jgi:hypothetical protein
VNKEDEKYVDAMFEMFRTEGWSMLMDRLAKDAIPINSVQSTTDNEDLWFRKGQMSTLNNVMAWETQVEAMAEEDEKDLWVDEDEKDL